MSLPAPRSLTLHDLASYAVPGLCSIRVQGTAPLPKDGPLLLLANPCSLLDPWLMLLAAGRAVQMPASSPLFVLPPLRRLANQLNTVPLAPGEAPSSQADFAAALDKGAATVLFGERRYEGPRYSIPPAFLEVLLATRSERIPVVPALTEGHGWRIEPTRHPLLAGLMSAGARVFNPAHPPVLYTDNRVRLGRPVYWRAGTDATLSDFRREVEDSLGALF